MLRARLLKIEQKRARSDPLPQTDAPYTDSFEFKVESSGSKPKARRLDHHFSLDSTEQVSSPLKDSSRSARDPSKPPIITLGTARPAPHFFPWTSLSMEGLPHNHFAKVGADSAPVSMGSINGENAYNLSIAMSYGYSAGSPQVLRFATEHVELVHNPPYDDWECCITCGTTSAMEIAFRVLCNRGDWVLLEGYTYPGTIAAANAQGLRTMGVEMDNDGLSPQHLRSILEGWNESKGRKPSVLYMIPSGQNPTGTSQSAARRKDIYRIAEEHDLYIIEDDPYYFFNLGESLDSEDGPTTPEVFLSRLPPSYLSLDTSGRVLRMDSVSKILAPGIRCGWVTASSQVIGKFVSQTEAGVLSPSGPSQVMVYKLLDETWGHEGLLWWLVHLSAQYRQRRDILFRACQKYLPLEICQCDLPKMGMFLWIQVSLSAHPLAGDRSASDIEDSIYNAALDNGVLVSKGTWFAQCKNQSGYLQFRLTYAAAEEIDLTKAVERFAVAVRAEFQLGETPPV
ncbi:hypothetical protein G7Z17_g655 [Cylindrodendrum hubeiense]|uniref:Aminotransferase class I/classII large domain-containing protein n=1 Tax=Cylindrodendrum hubeiense TaxID=595255 RepID=A0A9P5LM54_9HYPO|nr:hypothetical protein G7Z17_g655 [Cylindrodendrum hubeiense]